MSLPDKSDTALSDVVLENLAGAPFSARSVSSIEQVLAHCLDTITVFARCACVLHSGVCAASFFHMIRTFRGVMPKIATSAFIDSSAQVIGDVVIGERTSVWPNVAIRGDVNYIRIGDETSIQDNTVVHVDSKIYPCMIGSRVTVGHSAVLHGCEVHDGALIGIGAIVLNGAKIGSGAVVAAGALVPEGMDVPANTLVMGTPAKVKRPVAPEEQQRFQENCDNYVRLTAIYKEEQS